MPSDFECVTCKLAFSVGTYHYHVNKDGFFGSTLFVCRDCGLQHRLEIPNSTGSGTFFLESMNDLLIEPPRLAGTMLMMPDGEWCGRIAVESRRGDELLCLGCSLLGTLVDIVEPGTKCPNCGDMLPRPLADWMT